MGTRQKSDHQQVFRKQPITCPWITTQPYQSSARCKNRLANATQTDPLLLNNANGHWGAVKPGIPNKPSDKPTPSIQQSSSQFFYFLRLMQLFPETHPATLHTVLDLCKNDFFCAVDKLLYAKRCRLLCYKRNLIQNKCANGNNTNAIAHHQKLNGTNAGEMIPSGSGTGNTKDNAGDAGKARVDAVILQENVMVSNLGVKENIPVVIQCTEKPADLSTIKARSSN